jgi:SAM-dependent methyltransferase
LVPAAVEPDASAGPELELATPQWSRVRKTARAVHRFVSSVLFDPLQLIMRWRGLPYFLRNSLAYSNLQRGSAFPLRAHDLHYRSFDRFGHAADCDPHYFLQDIWAARILHELGVTTHVDVASRVDGFVAHLLTFCTVRYVDIRPLPITVEGLEYIPGTLARLPFTDASLQTLSCLHVIEHIGLGRYGDPVDPAGHAAAAAELVRVLHPGGVLLIGTPVGRERLCFDAHRVFDPATVQALFGELELERFALINDQGAGILQDATFENARRCEYGCGLFMFRKPFT